MEQDGMEFELVAASLRADAGDSEAFLQALASKLCGALPEQTALRHHGGLLGKKTVQGLDVDLGDVRYHLERTGGRLQASRQKAVRGIVLKNEAMDVDVWIDELSRAVSDQAKRSETGRMALQRMIEES